MCVCYFVQAKKLPSSWLWATATSQVLYISIYIKRVHYRPRKIYYLLNPLSVIDQLVLIPVKKTRKEMFFL